MGRWFVVIKYFEKLFQSDPLSGHLQTAGLQTLDADPPIEKSAPTTDDAKEAVAKFRGRNAVGICNISAELLTPGYQAP